MFSCSSSTYVIATVLGIFTTLAGLSSVINVTWLRCFVYAALGFLVFFSVAFLLSSGSSASLLLLRQLSLVLSLLDSRSLVSLCVGFRLPEVSSLFSSSFVFGSLSSTFFCFLFPLPVFAPSLFCELFLLLSTLLLVLLVLTLSKLSTIL